MELSGIIPIQDANGVPFRGDMLDDLRVILLLRVIQKKRWRPAWLLWKMVRTYPGDEMNRLMGAVREYNATIALAYRELLESEDIETEEGDSE